MTELNVYDFHPPLCSHCMESLDWVGSSWGGWVNSGWECKGCAIRWEPDGTGARLKAEMQ